MQLRRHFPKQTPLRLPTNDDGNGKPRMEVTCIAPPHFVAKVPLNHVSSSFDDYISSSTTLTPCLSAPPPALRSPPCPTSTSARTLRTRQHALVDHRTPPRFPLKSVLESLETRSRSG
ncbi:hypothetical protein AC578_5337 [Pseudocercospora eumusae]|uniref:Uncharacterized protein n=1 Tax=Pseudocercospora eumusae TaxID=321146 RepID=A0A139H2T6_9PEZI|nr:hypothetical protein AC578_5337 [Pseudocercospora eumusae]